MRRIFPVLLAGSSFVSLAAPAFAEPLLHVPSPDWRDQIIYFALTDRFNDGDPSNNDQGAGEFDPQDHRKFSGGDLKGMKAQLDYMQKLGATALWLTPPVANQWWYPKGQYGGYHGYWATNFKQNDPHFGTLEDYQALSDDLHRRGMYLIQDIVVNHTGNFFGYEGEYDPQDTAKHFRVFADEHPGNRFPTQAPFELVDRHNPEHVAADIYHWTPPITDYQDPAQEFTHQLANLSDLNTSNPRVRETLKDSYRYWIETVGVDAFRVDTAKYVEHDFWHDFLHAPNGIMAAAKGTGRHDFLAFGEIFDGSAPMQNSGEHKLVSFLGTKDKPELNSVIGFPLFFELGRVMAEGAPTAQLAYRLEQQMAVYPNPWVIPNFVDNHDTRRFLSSGSLESFRQAMAVIFTVPGIPVIYQGDEQALTQTRQAMFAGGYGSSQSQFDTDSPMFRFVRDLAALRLSDKALTRGDLRVLASASQGAGILGFERSYQDEQDKQAAQQRTLVLMNTAQSAQLLANMPLQAGHWQLVLDEKGAVADKPVLSSSGELTMNLPAKAIRVYRWVGESAAVQSELTPELMPEKKPALTLETRLQGQTLTADTLLQGHFSQPDSQLQLVLNGNLDTAVPLTVSADGKWQYPLPVRSLGNWPQSINLYAPGLALAGETVSFTTQVLTPAWQLEVTDPVGDEAYQRPNHANSGAQRDITAASVRSGGSVLELTLSMAEISDGWQPAQGFDNVSFDIYFDLSSQLPHANAASALPDLKADMPQGHWHLGHTLHGWGNTLFIPGATDSAGKLGIARVAPAPKVTVDKAAGTLTLSYQGEGLGLQQWDGVSIYITTWDRSGEGDLRLVTPQASSWSFGGGDSQSPLIMDSLWLDTKLKQASTLSPNTSSTIE
ncbi:alpha-amylase family glycosyl hydrolase [Shewanella sp. GXUN23E]|uniref:alpha-amylase family glycosyl hydrolase n=1 Tax=Shewanella sp. GXUN23E TaxID=3422498 RepID=UPI003D7C8E52